MFSADDRRAVVRWRNDWLASWFDMAIHVRPHRIPIPLRTIYDSFCDRNYPGISIGALVCKLHRLAWHSREASLGTR